MDRPVLVRIAPGGDREFAAAIETVPPLQGRRSTLCAVGCQESAASACSLELINDAGRVAATPLVRVWTESVVVGLLSGLRPARISAATGSILTGCNPRVIACAVAHGVDLSLASRRSALRAYVDPNEFEVVLHRQLMHQVVEGTPLEVPDWSRWLAGPSRWSDISDAVRAHLESGGAPDPADVEDWLTRRAALVGSGPADWVNSLAEQAMRQPRAALSGDTTATGLASAINDLSGDTDLDAVRYAVRAACDGHVAAVTYELHDAIRADRSV